jgi:hypothetical protein
LFFSTRTFVFIFRSHSWPLHALFLIIQISLLFPTSPQFFSACSRLSPILVCSLPSLSHSSSYVSVSLSHSSPLVFISFTFFSACSCLSILFVFLCLCLSSPVLILFFCLSISWSPVVTVSPSYSWLSITYFLYAIIWTRFTMSS